MKHIYTMSIDFTCHEDQAAEVAEIIAEGAVRAAEAVGCDTVAQPYDELPTEQTRIHAMPSAGALRAAFAIINSTANPALSVQTQNLTARRIAPIIDRETALPELLRAGQDFVDYSDDPNMQVSVLKERMRHALTRAAGGQYGR